MNSNQMQSIATKVRRIPIQLQEAVPEEFEKLVEEGHLKSVTEVIDKEFIQREVMLVKKDESVKFHLTHGH